MTAKGRIRKYQARPDANICEGQQKNVYLGRVEFFGIEGFLPTDCGKWAYQWLPLNDFPIFNLSVEDCGIVIAKHGDQTIIFIDIEAADIKARLDDETLAIMRHDAVVEDAINWDEFEEAMRADGWDEMVRDF